MSLLYGLLIVYWICGFLFCAYKAFWDRYDPSSWLMIGLFSPLLIIAIPFGILILCVMEIENKFWSWRDKLIAQRELKQEQFGE